MTLKRTGYAVLFIVLLLGILPFLHKGTGGTSELPVYTIAADRMLAGEEIYRLSDLKPFTYPPFFAVPFIPFPDLTIEPPREAPPFVAWYLITLLSVVIAVTLIRQHLPLDQLTFPNWLFYLVTLLIAGRYLGSVFGNQSHDLLVLLPIIIAADQLIRGRQKTAGLLLGIAAAFKATPLLFMVLLVAQKRWGALAAMLGTLCAVSLAPDLMFPRQDDQLWVMVWLNTFVLKLSSGGPADTGPWNAASILNQSLAGTLHRILDTEYMRWFILAGQATVLALVGRCVLHPARDKVLLLAQFSAVLCGMVLLSPMSGKAHFCVLLLPVAVVCWDALSSRRVLSFAGLAFAFSAGTLTSKDLIGRELGDQVLAWGTATWISVALLICLAVICHSLDNTGQIDPVKPTDHS